jgi:hypothetical protein
MDDALQHMNAAARKAVDDALKNGVPFLQVVGCLERIKSDALDLWKIQEAQRAQQKPKLFVPHIEPKGPAYGSDAACD